jgi:hypothetical protein
MSEIDVILGKAGGQTKVNEGNKRVPGGVYTQNRPDTPTIAEVNARGPKKRFQQRLPGMAEAEARNYDPGIAELQRKPYATPYSPGEYVNAMPSLETQALQQGQALVAQATGAPPLPLPEQAAAPMAALQAAPQMAPQAAPPPSPQAAPGPRVNWQNGPSREFYEANAGWNPDKGIGLAQMGRNPQTAQGLPNISKAIMEQGPQQQISQQRQMMETAFANAGDNESTQSVLQANRAMLDKFGNMGGNPLLGGSFLGRLFGGLF